jgi:hypothetical protein
MPSMLLRVVCHEWLVRGRSVGVEVKWALWLENGFGGPKNIRKCPNREFKHATYLNFIIKVNT